MTGNDDVAARSAADQAAAREAAEVADQQGLLFDDDVSPLPERRRLPRPDGLQRRRHHLPAARLLGPHRSRRAERARRHRLRHPAALLASATSSCSRSSSGCSTPGVSLQKIRTAVAAPPRARHRRPDPCHADERRRHGLRVHEQPTRSSTCSRAARASSASRSAVSGARSRGRSPSCPASAPPSPTTVTPPTSSPPAAAPASPADRFTRTSHGCPGLMPGASVRDGEIHGAWPRLVVLQTPRGRVSDHLPVGAPKGQTLPGTSQAPGPRGRGNSGGRPPGRATEGEAT